MNDLHVDNLIDLMPESVREEYMLAGDASIFGFSPFVKHWLKTSAHPRVEKWRDDMKRYTAVEYLKALAWQERATDLAHQMPGSNNGSIRRVMVPIHPAIKAKMEREDRHAFKDPAALADTKMKHPKLFEK